MKRASQAEKCEGKKAKAAAAEEEEEEEDILEEGEGDEEEEDGEDEDDDEEEEESGGELEQLPRALLEYAEGILEETSACVDMAKWSLALKGLEKARLVSLHLHADIQAMLEQAKKRGAIGGGAKVPPGSSSVFRSKDDSRFLLSLISIAHAKIVTAMEKNASCVQVVASLREALLFFPRSIEALHMLAKALKPLATTDEALTEVEMLLKKAVSTLPSLQTVQVANDDDMEVMLREKESGKESQDSLILLLCQGGRFEEAKKYLQTRGFSWRLSKQVLAYDLEAATVTSTSMPLVDLEHVKAFDGVFSSSVLDNLRFVFRPEAPFWKEHEYDLTTNSSRSVGYFSYLWPLKERPAPSNCIEQIVKQVYELVCSKYPRVREECNYAEWWVHTRPHTSGHQLHYDSDETGIEDGQPPMHPLISTVLYVEEEVGGPTLVTNQLLGGGLAESGWICCPKVNRLLMFDAKYLHGVLPGRGPNINPNARRLTFMVGFWNRICAKDRGLDNAGPGQPMPSIHSNKHSWPRELELKRELEAQVDVSACRQINLHHLDAVWEPVESNSSSSSGSSSSSSSSSSSNPPHYLRCFQGF